SEYGHGQKRYQPSQRQVDKECGVFAEFARYCEVGGGSTNQTDAPTEMLRIVAEELRPVGEQLVRIELVPCLRIDVVQVAELYDPPAAHGCFQSPRSHTGLSER